MAKKTKPAPKTKPATVKEPAHDAQEAHEQQLQGDSDPGDESEGSEINANPDITSAHRNEGVLDIENDDDPDARIRVCLGDVGDKPYSMNGHPMKSGQVFMMHPNDANKHRSANVPILTVAEDEECEVYEPDIYNDKYVNPEHEEA